MELFVYADSIFLVLLPIEFGLLELMDFRYKSSSFLRKTVAASVGTIFFLMSFGGGRFYQLRTAICILTGNILMLRIAFPVTGLKSFLNTLEMYLKDSVLLGGLLALLIKILPLKTLGVWKTWGMVVGINILLIFLAGRRKAHQRKKELCKVILHQGGKEAELEGILDTGNSLREPISGEPVSIIPAEILDYLWDKEALFRIVPFCSIDQKGLLKAYLLDELTINLNGHLRKYKRVFVAACNWSVNDRIQRVIINPTMLK